MSNGLIFQTQCASNPVTLAISPAHFTPNKDKPGVRFPPEQTSPEGRGRPKCLGPATWRETPPRGEADPDPLAPTTRTVLFADTKKKKGKKRIHDAVQNFYF